MALNPSLTLGGGKSDSAALLFIVIVNKLISCIYTIDVKLLLLITVIMHITTVFVFCYGRYMIMFC